MSPLDASPALGRPRSAEADEAIALATMELLAENGFEGVTVEAVASRAGVAKSTVYRRYPCRTELLVEVIRREAAQVREEVDTGSLVHDLVALARRLRDGLTGSTFGRALPAVMAAAASHAPVHEARQAFVATRRAPTLAAVSRAIDRGELPGGTDPSQVVDLLAGPVFYRLVVVGDPVSNQWLDRHVAHVVRAFRGDDRDAGDE